jgi:hypothetical protein
MTCALLQPVPVERLQLFGHDGGGGRAPSGNSYRASLWTFLPPRGWDYSHPGLPRSIPCSDSSRLPRGRSSADGSNERRIGFAQRGATANHSSTVQVQSGQAGVVVTVTNPLGNAIPDATVLLVEDESLREINGLTDA